VSQVRKGALDLGTLPNPQSFSLEKPESNLPDSDDSEFENYPPVKHEHESFKAGTGFDDSLFTGLELLAKYKTLSILNLANRLVIEIPWIRQLTGIKSLSLVYTRVSDLRPLSGLYGLESPDLRGAKAVQDLRPLASLVKIKYLDLHDTAVQRVKPLAGLANLENLILSRTLVENIAPLQSCAKLKSLNLTSSLVYNIAPLIQLKSLVSLYAADCRELSDISAVSQMTLMEELLISGDMIPDLSPLASLTNLRALTFWNENTLIDFSPLANLKRLETLEVGEMGMTAKDLSYLSRLPKLKILSSGVRISNSDLIKKMETPTEAPLLGLPITQWF